LSRTWPALWHDTLDSTNEEARRRATCGDFQDGWIAARAQTAGRGRLGREWVSPAGNLFATALFREPGGLAVATRIPFAAALGVHDVLVGFAPAARIALKWPNDVRIDGAKISGILVESGETSGVVWIAAGIGINVADVPEGAGQEATCLADQRGDNSVSADMVLDELRGAFASRLDQARTDFAATRSDWLARGEGLGGPVRVLVGSRPVEGVFETLAEDGGLVLSMADGGRQVIRAGDVELVRRA
jgi:BirA family transcriptional regulator, biotin operon repressor / biotin---[acetyl-CoA-carboxylase] ligase